MVRFVGCWADICLGINIGIVVLDILVLSIGIVILAIVKPIKAILSPPILKTWQVNAM